MKLKYQSVIHPEGSIAIHETTVDKDGNITAASYDAVKLESPSAGELEMLLRQVYRTLTKTRPISIEELEALIYKTESSSVGMDLDDADITNVVSLVDYLAR